MRGATPSLHNYARFGPWAVKTCHGVASFIAPVCALFGHVVVRLRDLATYLSVRLGVVAKYTEESDYRAIRKTRASRCSENKFLVRKVLESRVFG